MTRALRRDSTENAMVKWLDEHGYLFEYLYPMSGGLPDLLVGAPWGELVLVECKSITGRLNAKQREWHTRWKAYPRCMPRSVTELRGWMEKRRRAYLRERAA